MCRKPPNCARRETRSARTGETLVHTTRTWTTGWLTRPQLSQRVTSKQSKTSFPTRAAAVWLIVARTRRLGTKRRAPGLADPSEVAVSQHSLKILHVMRVRGGPAAYAGYAVGTARRPYDDGTEPARPSRQRTAVACWKGLHIRPVDQ